MPSVSNLNLKPQTRRAAFEAVARKLDIKKKDTDLQHEVKVLFQRKLITLLSPWQYKFQQG